MVSISAHWQYSLTSTVAQLCRDCHPYRTILRGFVCNITENIADVESDLDLRFWEASEVGTGFNC